MSESESELEIELAHLLTILRYYGFNPAGEIRDEVADLLRSGLRRMLNEGRFQAKAEAEVF